MLSLTHGKVENNLHLKTIMLVLMAYNPYIPTKYQNQL